MFSFMLFIFLGFLAIIIVCLYFIYSQEKLCHVLRDEHAELRLLLRAMESRLASFEQGGERKEEDALLSLDFHKPEKRPVTNPDLDLHLDTDDTGQEQQTS